jgi:hypothetical protein
MAGFGYDDFRRDFTDSSDDDGSMICIDMSS